MQNNALGEDTSGYWKKLLKAEEPVPEDYVKNVESIFKPLRTPVRSFVDFFLKRHFSLSCSGLSNLPAAPPYIIASNHASSLDFPAILSCLPAAHQVKVCAMYKKFFDKLPPLRFIIKLFVPSFSVDLEKKPWQALSTAVKILKSGCILYIAPEGTRSKDGSMLPFKPGIGAVAIETRVPVVPVFISGSSQALPSGSLIPKKHPIRVIFGKPIYTDRYFEKKKELPAYEVYKELAGEIRDAIIVLQNDIMCKTL